MVKSTAYKLVIIPLLILIIVISLTACSKMASDFEVGVINTSSKGESNIDLYDNKGKRTSSLKIDLGDLNNGFLDPFKLGNKLYLNSSESYEEDSNNVIEYDMINNSYNTYPIDYGIVSLTADDKFIYTAKYLMNGTNIARYNKTNKKIEKNTLIEALAYHIIDNGENIYVFGKPENEDDKSYIYILDKENLMLNKTVAVDRTLGQYDSKVLNNTVYFSNQEGYVDKESGILGKYNFNNSEVSYIGLDEPYPNKIRIYKDKLFISHFNEAVGNGDKVTVLDTSTNEKKVTKFNHLVKYFEIKNDLMFITDGEIMYVYNVNNFSLEYSYKLKNRVKNSHVSGIFTK